MENLKYSNLGSETREFLDIFFFKKLIIKIVDYWFLCQSINLIIVAALNITYTKTEIP